jgi:hypothetical protein
MLGDDLGGLADDQPAPVAEQPAELATGRIGPRIASDALEDSELEIQGPGLASRHRKTGSIPAYPSSTLFDDLKANTEAPSAAPTAVATATGKT